jgi:protein gp37
VAAQPLDGREHREPPLVHRAHFLPCVPAAVRFISAEPLLGPLDGLELNGIDWKISGSESGRVTGHST